VAKQQRYADAWITTEKLTQRCSFHRKLWLKHRVNSGNPAPDNFGMETLSEAC